MFFFFSFWLSVQHFFPSFSIVTVCMQVNLIGHLSKYDVVKVGIEAVYLLCFTSTETRAKIWPLKYV